MKIDNFISQCVTYRVDSMFQPDIELNHEKLVKKIEGKSVLVIGGAGSIGSSFIKTLLPYQPAELYLVDTNENALTELTRDLRSEGEFVPPIYVTYPMDYNSATFQKMFLWHHGFDIVANFSAHKHVRSEKDIFSVEALFTNNVFHVKKLLELLATFPPEVYFCVSTDKAVNPVNFMGVSKRIMEDLIFSWSDVFPVKTARFANVAFSNGSLPAGFLSRMEKLQPLAVPSDVKRYFISPQESGQICMLSMMLGRNREIFFPKLEQKSMMDFVSIGENLLRESGYEPVFCVSEEEALSRIPDLRAGSKLYPIIAHPSDTSGEKLYEEFWARGESIDMERFQSLGVITGKVRPEKKHVLEFLVSLEAIFANPNATKKELVEQIREYLPEFYHIETGKSLDGKM